MQDFREINLQNCLSQGRGGCWTWQRDVSTLSFHNIWPLQHQRLYGEDPSWIWQFILSCLQQKRGSFSSGALEKWATQSFCWFVVNVQGFVRNCEFRENLCRWQCMLHAGGGFVGGEGVLHQKNKKKQHFHQFFFSPVSILFFDDSSWPWQHLCGRRGAVGEVSVRIKQWMPADPDCVWANTGQFDS